MIFMLSSIFYPLKLTLPLKIPITDNFLHIYSFKKRNIVGIIYTLFSSWGPKNVPTRTRISDIAILYVPLM